MAITIDELEIQIISDSTKASKGIDALADTLKNLKGVLDGTSGVADNLKTLADAMRGLSSVGKTNLASTAKGITELSKATQSLDASRLEQLKQQMTGLASAMSVLSGVQKGGFTTVVNSLKKIPDITKSLDTATMDAFAAAIQRLTSTLAPLATQMDSISRGFSILPNRMRAVIRATEQTSNSCRRATRTYNSFFATISRGAARLWTLYFTAQRVVNIFADMYNESNEYIESLNLFEVSLGDAADAAKEYAEAVGDAMGIDPAEWMQNQGMFTRMSTGFGIASDQATIMGQNLTQLAYDMSSFFNTDVETAMQKLQSGMSGQIKGLKAWGYNLSVAALQETAYSLGIEQSVRTMTEAQKAQLRYITLIQKSNGIMGDMAKTITTPANAMRVLNAQIDLMRRALGNVVSVLVTRFIPWIMAAVQLVEEAASALAEAWGFEIPELPANNLEMGAEIIEGIGDEAEGAGEKAKELKKQLMGFDELNILKSNDSDSDAGIGTSYDLGFEMPSYDFMAGLEAMDLEPYKQKLMEIWDIVKWIGIAFLAWKISEGLTSALPDIISLLSKGGGFLPAWSKLATVLEGIGATFMILAGSKFTLEGVTDALKEGFDFENIFKTGGGSFSIVAGATWLGSLFANAFLGTAIGLIIAGLEIFIPSVADMFKNGIDWENGILVPLGTTLAGTGIGGIVGVIVGSIGGPMGMLVGAAIGAAVGLIIDGIGAFVEWATGDAVEAIEIFDDTISETTREKVEPFLDGMRELSTLNLKWELSDQVFATAEQIEAWSEELQKLESQEEPISQEDLARIKELNRLLSDTESIETYTAKLSDLVDVVKTELNTDRDSFLSTVSQIGANLSSEDLEGIRASLNEFYDNEIADLEDYQKQINDIMKTAAEEGRAITSGEWETINYIQSEMQSLGVQALSESAVEYETIMRNLADNTSRVSLEQAGEIIKNARDTRDETIKAAEDQYSRTLLEAQQLRDIGAINEEEYQAIVEAAQKTRDEAVSAANEQYDNIYKATSEKMGELMKYIDEETGKIKTNWAVFWGDVKQTFVDGWNSICEWWNGEVKTWWNESIAPWFTKEKWSGLWDDLVSWWEGLELPEINIKTPHFEWSTRPAEGWMADTLEFFGMPATLPKLDISWYASGGFPAMGSMFIANERGPELVGRIGNKNAVVNNEQIIQGIATAVYNAMMAAHEDGSSGGGGTSKIVVQIGDRAVGEASVRYINGQIMQTGASPIYT